MKLTIVVAAELLGLVAGTVTLCNPAVKNNLEVLAWLVSLLSTFGLLSTMLSHSPRPASFVIRAMVASAIIFVLVFASAMAAPMVYR
jgi:hypothetical protein